MYDNTLTELVVRDQAAIRVATSDSALFLAGLIAEYGYIQTAEFSQEVEASPLQLRKALTRLVDAHFAVYQSRPQGIFNGWVITEAGRQFLQSIGILDQSSCKHIVANDIRELVTNTLNAQNRFGEHAPDSDTVLAVLGSVPPDRQEWLGYAICYEPIPDDLADTNLSPPVFGIDALLLSSRNELTILKDRKRQTEWTKSRALGVTSRNWSELQHN